MIAKELTDAGATAEDIDKVPMPDKYRDWIIGNYFHSNLRYMLDKIKGQRPDSATAQ